MKKRLIYKAFITSIVLIIFSIICYLGTNNALISVIGFIVLFIMVNQTIILMVINKLIRSSAWYKARYKNAIKFKTLNFKRDLVVFGSSSAANIFLKDIYGDIKVANFSLTPQTLAMDFAVLKNYHSYMKKGAMLILIFNPYSSLVTQYAHVSTYYDKYYLILHPIYIPEFDMVKRKREENRFRKLGLYAILEIIKYYLKIVIKAILFRNNKKMNYKESADNYYQSWNEQFGINDSSDVLSMELVEKQKTNINLVKEMILFSEERDFKLTIVLPPVHKHLQEMFSQERLNNSVYTFVNEIISDTDIKFIDYFKDERFSTDDLYENALVLNEKGGELFSKQLLKDIY